MLTEECEELRSKLWDLIYQNGPMPYEALAEKAAISSSSVIDLTNHAWFSVHDGVVSIAVEGE